MKKILKKNGLKLDDITIDPELRDWLPPLDQQEMLKLIESIKTEGQRHPLVLWQNDGQTYLVDGHHRFKALRKLQMTDFNYEFKEFPDKQCAKDWMLESQLGQRNVTPFVKYLAMQGRMDEIKKEAKDRQLRGRVNHEGCGKTADVVGHAIGVSPSQVKKMNFIYRNASSDVLEQVKRRALSVDKAYKALKGLTEKITSRQQNLAFHKKYSLADLINDGDVWFQPCESANRKILDELRGLSPEDQKKFKISISIEVVEEEIFEVPALPSAQKLF